MHTNATNIFLRKAFFITLLIFIVAPAARVFAYDDQTTHPALTQEIVDFYNSQRPSDQITSEEKEWIVQGSIREDTPPRWINHFYDPINQVGWSGEKAGIIPQSAVQLFSRFGLSLEKPLSAVEWINSPLVQAEYARYEGDRTWKAALDYFADGDKKEAYKTLGHALHLLEDMSVPDHTRNDTHAHGIEAITGDEGSPFETYLSKYNPSNIEKELHLVSDLEREKVNLVQQQSITDYLISVAQYSNQYFFSKDTIDDLKYENPKIIRDDGIFGYGKDENSKEFPLARVKLVKKDSGEIEKVFEIKVLDVYYPILDAYFSRLAPKVIVNGAGVIQLFKKQAADAVVNKEYHLYKVDTLSVTFPVVSLYGELAKMWNGAQAFISKAGEAFENTMGAVQKFFAALFGTKNNNLKPAGAVVLDAVTPAGDTEKGNALQNPIIINAQKANSKNVSLGAERLQNELTKPKETAAPGKINSTSTIKNSKTEESKTIIPVAVKECAFAASQQPSRQGVIINEVAWMGSVSSANDEWIELKNISQNAVDLNNWHLIDKGEQIKVNLADVKTTKIPAGAFMLLERTNDDSAPNIVADLIYTGALSNANEGIRLFDSQCNVIDEAMANPDWPAGDQSARKTMERDANGFAWHTSNNVGGTPRRENSIAVLNTGGGGGGGGGSPIVSPAEPSLQSKLLITEIQITGGPGKTDNDFIEIYNLNDTQVNLNGYRLVKRTKTGTSDTSIKSWTDDVFIAPHGYYLWANSAYNDISVDPDIKTSASIANDNGIAIRFGPEDTGSIIDSVAWGEAQNVFVLSAAFGTNPGAGQSLQKKFDGTNYGDTGNNAEDFEISNCPSPKAQPTSCGSVLHQAPSVSFVFTPQNPKPNELILFSVVSSTDENALSSSSIFSISYLWDFGDGTFSTTTENSMRHTYASSGDFIVGLTALWSDNSSSTATTTIPVKLSAANHPLISEILFDSAGNDTGNEFIELYNPTNSDIDLGGWSLRVISSDSTTTKSLIAFGSKPEDSVLIKRSGFNLIGFNGYNGLVQADSIRSAPLPNATATIFVYDASDALVDSLVYGSEVVEGKSVERKSFGGTECISAVNVGEFLGNGCDTDAQSDFEIRDVPHPQNAHSLPEPRMAPSVPADFRVSYTSSSLNLHFDWEPSIDSEAATTTIIYELKNTASGELLSKGSGVDAFDKRIEEIGREYAFSLQVFDRDGLYSEFTHVSIAAPSILDSLIFSSETPSSTDYFVEPHFNEYPFVPDIFNKGQWRILIFYLNSDPVEEVNIGEGSSLEPVVTEHTLPLQYFRCTGSFSQGFSLILPDGWFACGVRGGAQNNAFDFSRIGAGSLKVQVDAAKLGRALTTSDYMTVGYYAVFDWAIGRGYNFKLVAKDFTKYFFTESVGVPVSE